MEPKRPSVTAVLVVTALLLVAAAAPSSCARGGLPAAGVGLQEVYEIDYRGPETHSSLPPPEVSRGAGDPKTKSKGSYSLGRKKASLAKEKQHHHG